MIKRIIGLFIVGISLSVDAKKIDRSSHIVPEKPSPEVPSKRKVEDKLLAIIYHSEGTVLICQSDLKADLSDKERTLKDAVIRELIILDGKKINMSVTDAEVERYLARIQEQLKLDKEGLIAFFKKEGLTLDRAKKELEKNILIEKVIDARVMSKSHPSQFDLQDYYEKNPIDLYTLSATQIPFNGGSKALTRALIEREIASEEINTKYSWMPRVIDSKDFAPEKAYLKDLTPGTVVIADETADELILLRFESKKRTPYEERKNDIAVTLKPLKYQTVQQAYYDKLLKDAKVHYIH